MRNADCDSPAAITALDLQIAERADPAGCRIACPACEKMSYEKLSPGWTSEP